MKRFVPLVAALSLLAAAFLPAAGAVPRPEHPRPSFERREWLNLNGTWTFAFDFGRTGAERGFPASTGFEREITVPFCPESALSGIGYWDFIPAIWYHRAIVVPEAWRGRRILLHFGGVDYESTVYIDNRRAGVHYGGGAPFCHDITSFVTPGRVHHLVVRAEDDLRAGTQPSGKQSRAFHSHGCFYTRTTGIWQTVWLEAAAMSGLAEVRVLPDPEAGCFHFEARLFAAASGQKLRVTVAAGDKKRFATAAIGQHAHLTVAVPLVRPWSPADPFLYDLTYEVIDAGGRVADRVKGYAGLRSVRVEGGRILLNGRPFFLRMVLDQGFYPDGVWTAPSEEALRRDIERAMQAGFNGARLHQKVFEERFHYWADRLGYLTWGESPSWGCDLNRPEAARNFLAEWGEIVRSLRNHPSIIAWSPFNETWERGGGDGGEHDRCLRDAYDLTHALDGTRPVNDASGLYHVKTDLWTVHEYEQDPDKFRQLVSPDPVAGVKPRKPEWEAAYAGQPYVVAEYGGIRWIVGPPHAANSWGYGEGPKSEEEFYARLGALTRVILSLPEACGFCYTQLTDVEQEQNGIYRFDRSPKFDMARIRAIFGAPR